MWEGEGGGLHNSPEQIKYLFKWFGRKWMYENDMSNLFTERGEGCVFCRTLNRWNIYLSDLIGNWCMYMFNLSTEGGEGWVFNQTLNGYLDSGHMAMSLNLK